MRLLSSLFVAFVFLFVVASSSLACTTKEVSHDFPGKFRDEKTSWSFQSTCTQQELSGMVASWASNKGYHLNQGMVDKEGKLWYQRGHGTHYVITLEQKNTKLFELQAFLFTGGYWQFRSMGVNPRYVPINGDGAMGWGHFKERAREDISPLINAFYLTPATR